MTDHSHINPDPLLNTREAAEYLGLTYKSLVWYRCKSNGGGPHFVKVGSTAVRYRKSDLDAYIQDGQQRPNMRRREAKVGDA